MKRHPITTLLLVVLCACADDGPVAPEPTRMVYTGTVNSTGEAVQHLPAAAGTFGNPPTLTCYLSSGTSSAWLIVNGRSTFATCHIVELGGVLSAVMIDAPPGFLYAFVVDW